MARRDAFTGLRDPNPMIEVEENQQQESMSIQRQPLDFIPTADLRKKRTRKWEQVHRLETVTYRGIPRQVVELIIEDAQSLSVPRDEVFDNQLHNLSRNSPVCHSFEPMNL